MWLALNMWLTVTVIGSYTHNRRQKSTKVYVTHTDCNIYTHTHTHSPSIRKLLFHISILKYTKLHTHACMCVHTHAHTHTHKHARTHTHIKKHFSCNYFGTNGQHWPLFQNYLAHLFHFQVLSFLPGGPFQFLTSVCAFPVLFPWPLFLNRNQRFDSSTQWTVSFSKALIITLKK